MALKRKEQEEEKLKQAEAAAAAAALENQGGTGTPVDAAETLEIEARLHVEHWSVRVCAFCSFCLAGGAGRRGHRLAARHEVRLSSCGTGFDWGGHG